MINFADNTVFPLKPIDTAKILNEVTGLLINNEIVLNAYQTIRDQVVFTNKRIICIDVQGITGKRKDFSSLPYSKIQYFSVRTPGFSGAVPNCELQLWFNNGFTAHFEISGECNIIEIGKSISNYILE